MFEGKSVLITGGTGSFGQAFIHRVLRICPGIKRLIVFSRDELKQYELAQRYPVERYKAMRYFLGDVRDKSRLMRAFVGVDIVVHAAALKQVPAAEYNPLEFIRTNVVGAENIIEASIECGVEKVVALSTDKAVSPTNLYGATKLCSDKLFVAANFYGARVGFFVVRYGNVLGSRGSVVPYFLNQAKSGSLTLTDPSMTRFSLTLDEGISFVLWSLEKVLGGEIFIPKLPSYCLGDLAEAIGPNCKIEMIGLRPGEKLHEELISEHSSMTTVDYGDAYAILPHIGQRTVAEYVESKGVRLVEPGFKYRSDINEYKLSVEQLRNLIRDHVDAEFTPQ